MDPGLIALLNLIVQVLLVGLLAYSGYTVKIKKDLKKHCRIMRVAVGILLVTVLAVMLPSLLSYTQGGLDSSLFYTEMLVHHSLGLVVVGIFIFANLAMAGVIKLKGRLVPYMRIAATAWALSLVLGIHLFFVIWG